MKGSFCYWGEKELFERLHAVSTVEGGEVVSLIYTPIEKIDDFKERTMAAIQYDMSEYFSADISKQENNRSSSSSSSSSAFSSSSSAFSSSSSSSSWVAGNGSAPLKFGGAESLLAADAPLQQQLSTLNQPQSHPHSYGEVGSHTPLVQLLHDGVADEADDQKGDFGLDKHLVFVWRYQQHKPIALSPLSLITTRSLWSSGSLMTGRWSVD